MRKILFITGTRADYGKMKALMKAVEKSDDFVLYMYVSGMHILDKFGGTYMEIQKDGYQNIYVAFSQFLSDSMSYNVGNIICNLTGYVRSMQPDLIVVHGDRIDALAGAIVGALNNIRVAHIEGGELSGTIDESIRHAVSKFANIHLVSTEEAKKRLIQLGENVQDIYIIGSPDVDVMLSDRLPSIEKVKRRYEIPFEHYAILMYHPVTTEFDSIHDNIEKVIQAVKESGENYVVIYPNNDMGSDLILDSYRQLNGKANFRIFPSIRFEYFLTLLKNTSFMLGNSSAGIRETCVYGIPSIDIGTRQNGRYSTEQLKNILHVSENIEEIIKAIGLTENYRVRTEMFGKGDSTERFMTIIQDEKLWSRHLQKHFCDIDDML